MDASIPLPASFYVSEEIFSREVARIWHSDWVFVGHRGQVLKAGDFFCFDIAGIPGVIVNDGRRLRAFNRLCRHRWVDLLDGCTAGRLDRFRCPYHLWTYNLQGELVAAPYMNESIGFEPRRLGLIEYRVATWCGLLFVTLSNEVGDLEPELTPLNGIAARFRLDEFRSVLVQSWDVASNWKFLADNSVEGYHHMGIHCNTLQRAIPGENLRVYGESPRAVVMRYQIAANLPVAQRELEKTDETMNPQRFEFLGSNEVDKLYMLYIYPNVEIILFRGQATVVSVAPVKAEQSVWSAVHLRLTDDENHANSADFKKAHAFFDAVNTEDMEVCETQQRYCRYNTIGVPPLSHLEAPVVAFQQYVLRRLAVTGAAPPKDASAALADVTK